jgi:hypothetical protein
LKKLFIFFICSIFLTIFFHNFIFYKIIHFYLEKITEKNVKLENVKVNFINKNLVLNNLKILNDQKFKYKNFIFCDEIKVFFNYSNLLKETIVVEEIKFKDPIIYLEIIEKENKLSSEDNISILEKKKDTYEEKIYPKKTKDRNIIFKSVKILNPQANLIIGKSYKYENLNLSDMKFNNVGTTSTNSTHFKKIFKTILTFIYIQIPNFEIQKKLKDFYMSD